MINQRMYDLGAAPSAIRETFAYGLRRKAQIGEDKVFDFSIGNPSVPTPDAVRAAIDKLGSLPSTTLHAYTPSQGDQAVRQIVADNLVKRFGSQLPIDAQPSAARVYMTCGAAASLSICITAVTNPGEEVIVIAPFFPEYRVWIETAGCTCVPVPARADDFQLDVPAIEAAINPKTAAIIINSPNNPTGAVYTRENIRELADALGRAERRLGHEIYLISDEPYRELAYRGEVTWVPGLWERTMVCYSWSKSFSLPGERIGYIYMADPADNDDDVFTAICGAGRALGFVCAPAMWQRIIAKCIDEPVNVDAYRRNRALLTQGLDHLGYHYIQPDGAFYLWMQALEPDAKAFCERARNHELLLVPSNSFGVEGWVRISYCVSEDVIVNSMPAFEALKRDYELYSAN